ncbi:hypothetical protein NQ317_009730 [Molorchus minor]|uniref:G-protein coupled receptors family 1 profile domain-containing protein n=1 Tax=Molorchus minor TaxID=1323400 RepID=A0ABQ9JDF6_9CUCU|nr:hypothetical protein NQ317_009730 [Molorchus minor]
MAHVYARPHHMLQTEEEVLDIVEDDPSTSTREIARQSDDEHLVSQIPRPFTMPAYYEKTNLTLENLSDTNSVVAVTDTDTYAFLKNFEITVPFEIPPVLMARSSKLIIPLYLIIFVLAVLGNSLVLVTLVRNKRMRTVTNVYLFNLAISDLLLGVFCMPFTLVGQVLRNFIFGSTMCKLIPYFQAIKTRIGLQVKPVSVSVGVWTLVAISLERYFAICRPLKSRRWQTQFHAYKMIAFVWLASLFWSGPVLAVSKLKAMKKGHKCREVWPNPRSEQIFNLFLDVMLLLIPMLIMSLAYSLIMSKLWKGLQREIQHTTTCQQLMLQRSCSSANVHELTEENKLASDTENGLPSLRQHRLTPPCNAKLMTTVTKNKKKSKVGGDKAETVKTWLMRGFVKVKLPHTTKSELRGFSCTKTTIVPPCKLNMSSSDVIPPQRAVHRRELRAAAENRRDDVYIQQAWHQVIRMLFVIVAEFFICWAPLHILNTWYLFYPDDVYKYIGSTGISLVQLLAYVSSCCNPITYCFMNRKFRQAFLTAFNCRACCWCDESVHGLTKYNNNGIIKNVQNNSDVSGNDSTVCLGRASMIARSDYLGVSSSTSGTRVAQVIEADPDDETFRYRITWIRPPNCGGSSSASSSLYA